MIQRGYARCRDGQIHYSVAGPADAPFNAFFHQTASSGAAGAGQTALERRPRCGRSAQLARFSKAAVCSGGR